jgi:hypothetical protein
MQVQYINPMYVHQVWHLVEKYLEKGLARSGGEYNVDQLKVFLVSGDQQLLVAVDDNGDVCGAAAVQFINYPNDRVAFITSVGGKMIANLEVWQQFEEWCKQSGATMVRGAAFESVARLWKKAFGVEQRYVIVEKKL